MNFLINFLDELNIFVKVMLSDDRFMSVWLKPWKTTSFRSKQALIACLALVVFFMIFHSTVLFSFGNQEYGANGTYYTDYCNSALEFKMLKQLIRYLL